MQKPTKVALNDEARKHILSGVKTIYDAVRLTLGPEGGNALLYRTYGRGPRITNDGKTIAEVIEPTNEFQKLVASSYKEACKRTDEEAGDGTTTTTVISGHLITTTLNELLERNKGMIVTSNGVMTIRKELLAAKDLVIAEINKRAKKVKNKKELLQIATVSVEDAELGQLVSDMVWETGVDGHVDVVEGFKGVIEHEIVKGMRFPAKVAAKGFINNPSRAEMKMEDVPVLITNYALDNVAVAKDLINGLLTEGKTKKLAVLAPSFSDEVLASMLSACIVRQQDGTYAKTGYELYPVHVPSLRTEQFQDVAAYIGGTFIDKQENMTLSTVKWSDVGFLEKLIVKDVELREDAVATGGRGAKTDAIEKRVAELKKRLTEGFKVETHKKIIEKRIASMSSAIGIIRVGAQSNAEGLYKKLKIEDAVYACKSALQEGYVKGGGLCLKEIAEQLPSSRLTASLKRPYEQIMENADNALEIGDEIIDPAKSVRLAVENAVSVTAHLITVKAIIPEVNDITPGEGYKSIAQALHTANAMNATEKKLNLQKIRNDEQDYWANVDDIIAGDKD